MLEVRDLVIGYPGRPVCRELTFSVGRGEIVALLGANGSGKTTMFRTIAGRLVPLQGSTQLDGQDLTKISVSHRARRMAYVPQFQQQVFPYKVLDAVALGRLPHLGYFGAPGTADRRAALVALEQVDTLGLSDRLLTELSGGERQRVLLARALVQGSDLLLLDEPTAHLDFGQTHRILRLVRRMANSGKSILWTTHDPSQALQWADRVVLLHDGSMLSYGPPGKVLDANIFEKVFGVRARVHVMHDQRGSAHHHCLIEEFQ